MIRRMMIAALAVGSLVGANGCRHSCCKSGSVPNPFLPPPPGGPLTTIPPTSVPTAPGSIPAFPPPARSGSIPPPDPLFGGAGNFSSPSSSAKPPAEILLPDPLPPSSGTSRAQAPSESRSLLGEPSGPTPTAEPPLSKSESATPANGFPPPADASRPAPKPTVQTSRFPGLPGFAIVKDGVGTGRQPTPAGLDLLKKSGYRTLVYLHGENADDSVLKGEAEKRGFTFTAIETTPGRLTTAAESFNRVVGTPASRPVYICDDEGLRAGVLWYVHFRTVEILNADAANVRARPLGYTDQGESAQTFQVAVQRYLETR